MLAACQFLGMGMPSCQSVGPSDHHFGPDCDISTNAGWIAMTFGTDIHVPLWMNCNNYDDLLTFHLAPPSGEISVQHFVA